MRTSTKAKAQQRAPSAKTAAPATLGVVLESSLSTVAGGFGGRLKLDASECRAILDALEHPKPLPAPRPLKPLDEALHAALSRGAAGKGLSAGASDCQAILDAAAFARQSVSPALPNTDTDPVTAFRLSLPIEPSCPMCRASTMGGQPPMACWRHALPAAVAERARLKRQFDDVEALVHALVDTFGERKTVPGQVVMGLAVQVQAIRDDGGTP